MGINRYKERLPAEDWLHRIETWKCNDPTVSEWDCLYATGQNTTECGRI